ncbi:MAG TPA: pilin [Candidatus Dojkabacteria bacterium]|nr:pilin [Candidatus Dojkabacteria bacterium]
MKDTLLKISRLGILAFGILPTLFVKKTFAMDPLEWLKQITELPNSSTSLEDFIIKIINWAIGFSAIVAVVMIVFAGFKYITANGDENKISSATKTLTFAIVGLVVCFIAVMLVNFVIAEFLLK